MALTSINTAISGGWRRIASTVQGMKEDLFGKEPNLPAVDITDLEIPADALTAIREKNRKRVREELSLEEVTGPDSVFVKGTFFDDQLLEVLFSIQDKYQPEEFIAQLVQLIMKFLNESAAFRTGALLKRVGRANANQCVSVIKQAWDKATDPEEKQLLELLVTDFSYGGQEPWVVHLQPELKEFVQQAVARQAG